MKTKKRNLFFALLLPVGLCASLSVHFLCNRNKTKAINDTYGHPVGDSVLRCIGRALIQATSNTKACFRYGGDEFAVILPETTLLQAQEMKKYMEEEIGAITIPELKGMKISASIGMAEWLPGITVETLIDLADKDLYVQKQKKAAL